MSRLLLSATALSLAAALLAPPAQAVIYGGNPHINFTVDRPQHDLDSGEVDIKRVRFHYCGGGYTDAVVNETDVDIVDGWGVDFAPGDYCAVKVYWDTEMLLDGTNVNDASAFTISSDAAFTHINLSTSTAAFSQVDWVVGVIYGGNPHITATVTE